MLIQILVQGFPEVVSLVLVMLVLIGCRIPASKFLLIALLMTCLIALVRSIPLTYGFHIISGMIVLGLLVSLLTRKPLAKTLVAAAASYLILIFYETIFHFLLFNLFNLKIDPQTNNILWITIGWPHTIAMFLTALILWKKDIRIKF